MFNRSFLVGCGVGGGMAHKFWRLYFITKGSGADYASAYEIEMRATPGGSDQCTGGAATASSTDSVYVPGRAFDNNTGSVYAWISAAGLANQWIAYEFPEPVSVAELWYMPYYFGSVLYGPSEFSIEYSDNGSDWTRLKTFSGLTWASGEAKTFAVS